MSVPELRIRRANEAPVAADGDYVLYWMIAQRRLSWNYGLDRALEWCRELGKPLLVFEPLRVGYAWASRRFHQFVLDGMREHAGQLESARIAYLPYVEPQAGVGSGLLEALAGQAAVVVSDDYPCFFLPRMVAAAAERLPVRLEAVEGNGLLPLAATDKVFSRAVDLRRHLQKTLRPWLLEAPAEKPFAESRVGAGAEVPAEILERWPALPDDDDFIEDLAIDQAVLPAALGGGERAAQERLASFLDERLGDYTESRNEPAVEVTSGLSPYLHWGHLSVHQIFRDLAEQEVVGQFVLTHYPSPWFRGACLCRA